MLVVVRNSILAGRKLQLTIYSVLVDADWLLEFKLYRNIQH